MQHSDSTPIWTAITQRWSYAGIAIRPGVSSKCIAAFESKHGIAIPTDVRNYFLFCDGMGDEMDHDLFRFWTFAELVPVAESLKSGNGDRYSYPGYFSFADHCINCWDYAVLLTSDESQPAPVRRVTGELPAGEVVSNSFIDFMARYAADPNDIL